MTKLRYIGKVMRTIAVVIVLSHSTAWAQKAKVTAQLPDSVVFGQWFVVPYTIDGSNENTRVAMDANSGFDTMRIVSRLQSNVLKVKYALRANEEIGKLSLPRLSAVNGNKRIQSKSKKIEVKPSGMPWAHDDGRVKAFVKTELSKPYLTLGDTLTVSYKLYVSAAAMLDWRIMEFHLPSGREFFSLYHRTNLEASGEYGYLKGQFGGPCFVVDLGRYVLQAKGRGRFAVGEGYITVDYLLDRSDVLTKMFVSERKIANDRRKIIVPIERVEIQVVDQRP